MPKLPDFEGLALFAKVAEEGSFAAAARALGLSVATVSRAVARLEDRLGSRLFNRTSRRISLTGFGRELAERAQQLLADAEAAERLALESARSPRGLIRLAAPMSFGLRWIGPLLPDFFRRFPEISVDLHLSDEQVDLVGAGFDAAIRIAVLDDSSLVARKIAPVRRFILASPAYIARYGRPQHPHDLIAHHCLGYAFRARRDVWRLSTASGEEVTVEPTGFLRVTNSDALLPTLLDGMAIAELPDFIAAAHLASGALQIVLPDWRFAEGGVYFVTPTARARAAKVEALAGFVQERLGGQDWRKAPAPSVFP